MQIPDSVSRWLRVSATPDSRLTFTQRQKIPFHNRCMTKCKVAIKEIIHGPPIDLIVVVGKLCVKHGRKPVGDPHHLINVLKIRKTTGFQIDRPVIGSSQSQRPRRGCCCNINISLIDSQQRRIFTCAPTLHGGRDHDARHGGGDAFIDSTKNHRLSTTTTRSRHTNARRIYVIELQHKVDCPDRIPGLQSHHILKPKFRLDTHESPVV